MSLERRDRDYQAVFRDIKSANAEMTPDRQQYFYENVAFPLLIDWRQTTAADQVIKAFDEPDDARRADADGGGV